MSKTITAFILALFVTLAFAALSCLALGKTVAAADEMQMPPLSMFHKLGLSGICGDQEYLYIMAGGKIMLYQLSNMALLKTVDLPETAAPPGPPPQEIDSRPFPPPPPVAGPHGLWSDDHFLYVLAGPSIHEYSIPDLALLNTVELPKPDFEKLGD